MQSLRRLKPLRNWVADLDRDVADNRAERRAQTDILNALGETQAAHSRTLRRIADQVAQLTVGQDELKGGQTGHSITLGELRAVQLEMAAVQLGLVKGQAELTLRVGGLDTKADALDTRVDTLETKVDALDTKVDTLETKVDALDTKVDALATAIGEVLRRLPEPPPSANAS